MAKRYGGVVDNRKRNGAMGGFVTLAVIGVGGYLIWKYALNSPTDLESAQDGLANFTDMVGEQWDELDIPGVDLDNFTDVLDGLSDDLFAELYGGDPMLGDNVTINWDEQYVQRNDGGLHLTLQNALDDTWQSEFEAAVADWQESDALQLTTERVAVDYNCNRVDGVMVVCNANFGKTGWVGINENSILGDVVVSSVAKMNEYYLRNADFDHRRFTMCHEIGHGRYFSSICVSSRYRNHITKINLTLDPDRSFPNFTISGFGLPHTDENPYNSNLGNCLGIRFRSWICSSVVTILNSCPQTTFPFLFFSPTAGMMQITLTLQVLI